MPRALWRGTVLGALLTGSAAMAQPQPPGRGTIVSAMEGDAGCYLRIRDEAGQVGRWMGSFDICPQAERMLGRMVTLRWSEERVMHPSCQGDPSCRRTRVVMLVSGIGR